MTRNGRSDAKRDLPRPTPPPEPNTNAITPTERWYLDCLTLITGHLGRPPSMVEFSAWLKRSHTPIYIALRRLEAKGYVRRHPKTRKFHVIATAA